MSAPANPYQAPQSAVKESEGESQPVRLFAVSGRIGRLRYICYGLLVYLVLALVAGVFAAVAAPAGVFMVGLAWLAMLVIGFMLTIQRSHDFNTSGWLSILMLVPLVNLMFWFIPGTDGPNRYGPPTPPNSTGVIIGAIAVPVVLVFFVGILAAVAIPAYDDYGQRAKVSEVIVSGSALRTAVTEHYAETKRLPSSIQEIKGAPTSTDSKWGIATLGENGVITLTLARQMGAASDKTILMRPTVAGASLNWDCTGGTLPPKFRPRSCRAG
ncbi:MAG: hypothetical protein QOD26_1158 [Betaproteobacteria bacterium]|jgi:uncharacterized membrane protein YhaH (DUF805 family)|nr:hypothetical protein [Betaproteobacteria bacterium]